MQGWRTEQTEENQGRHPNIQRPKRFLRAHKLLRYHKGTTNLQRLEGMNRSYMLQELDEWMSCRCGASKGVAGEIRSSMPSLHRQGNLDQHYGKGIVMGILLSE